MDVARGIAWRIARCPQIAADRYGLQLLCRCIYQCLCCYTCAGGKRLYRTEAIIAPLATLFLRVYYANGTAYGPSHQKFEKALWYSHRHLVYSPVAYWFYILYARIGVSCWQCFLLLSKSKAKICIKATQKD